MNNSKNWVIANGGNVGLYIQDPNLGHGGFMQTTAYMDSLLNYYKPCFTGVGLKSNKLDQPILFYPNPASDHIIVDSNRAYGENLFIYDQLGLLSKHITINDGKTKVDISDLPKGMYFLEVNNRKTKFIKE